MSDAAMECAKLKLKLKRESERKNKKMNKETQTAIVPAANCTNSMTALQLCEHIQGVEQIGAIMAQSCFFGNITQSAAKAAVMNCMVEGLSFMEYKAKYHTFEDGTTSVKSDFIQREFHRLGGEWDFNAWTPDVCDMTFTYKGKKLDMKVTLAEFVANKVAVGKDGKTLKVNWSRFPREMLKARCMATAIRAICPEALGGMYTQEEVADFDRKPPTTVQVVASPSPIVDDRPEAAEPEVVDYAVCPCGKSKGKRFDELPTETLEKIVALPADKYPLVTPEHKNEIVRILGEREAAENKNK